MVFWSWVRQCKHARTLMKYRNNVEHLLRRAGACTVGMPVRHPTGPAFWRWPSHVIRAHARSAADRRYGVVRAWLSLYLAASRGECRTVVNRYGAAACWLFLGRRMQGTRRCVRHRRRQAGRCCAEVRLAVFNALARQGAAWSRPSWRRNKP
jgi:hypothetical protein